MLRLLFVKSKNYNVPKYSYSYYSTLFLLCPDMIPNYTPFNGIIDIGDADGN